MAGKKRRAQPQPDPGPIVVDDFIYNDPDAPQADAPASDTPEDALRKLRTRPKAESSGGRTPSGAPAEAGKASRDDAPEAGKSGESAESAPAGDAPAGADPAAGDRPGRKVYSTGVILDEDLQPVDTKGRRPRREHRVLRGLALGGITLVLLLTVAAYIFHRISPETPLLGEPESLISRIVTPVQSVFSGITEAFAGYFRSMKLRANLENEYNRLREENEQLVYQAMLADELRQTLSQYEDLSDEIRANISMRPIVCTIIGKSDSNYFSTFTINKGTADGVEDYMAVTISGALVGYTENAQPHSATVRTIIDSNASIAALIQSSRDQGTVRGTLGTDGQPMCRMYYLPSDNIPRSGDLVVTSGVGMSFPKGIPIGVVRESTRGMQDNKQYIVLEPQVDFRHLEYVVVLRYKPEPIAVEGRESEDLPLVPLESARPSPVIPEIADSLFNTPAPTPAETDAEPELGEDGEPLSATPSPTPAPSASPTPSPSPSPSPDPAATPAPPSPTPLEYRVVNLNRDDQAPTPTPTWAPTSTPYLTPDPDGMTWEDG